MHEIFPVIAGLVLGLVLGSLTARRKLVVGLICSVAAGLLATVSSGEWRVSWGYLLVDIPLVAASAVGGDLLARAAVLRHVRR